MAAITIQLFFIAFKDTPQSVSRVDFEWGTIFIKHPHWNKAVFLTMASEVLLVQLGVKIRQHHLFQIPMDYVQYPGPICQHSLLKTAF